jgi:hypothetical protein
LNKKRKKRLNNPRKRKKRDIKEAVEEVEVEAEEEEENKMKKKENIRVKDQCIRRNSPGMDREKSVLSVR